MKPLFCETCKEEKTVVHTDGYLFGERIVEGVIFIIEIKDGKIKCTGVGESSKQYMEQLNWEHWKKRCEDFADDAEEFTCPECGDDIYIEDSE